MGRPRVRKVSGSGDARRDILAAAASLISRQGLRATTLAQIADVAGLQTPSLYYYFANKGAILLELAVDANRGPLTLVDLVNASDEAADIRLWSFVCLDLQALCALPFDINEVHRFASEDPASDEVYRQARERLIGEVASIVSAGVAEGSFRRVRARMTALTLLGNDEGSQNWMRVDRSADPAEVGEFLADFALRSLLTDATEIDRIRRRGRKLVARLACEPLTPLAGAGELTERSS
jgi:AcrR family transcriptional regulator